jgi:hypothetical protein
VYAAIAIQNAAQIARAMLSRRIARAEKKAGADAMRR